MTSNESLICDSLRFRIHSLTEYIPPSSHLFPVYDVTKRASFVNLQRWIEEVRRYTASNVIVFLIGNKCDEEDLREVDFEEADALAQYIPEIRLCMETSAKDNKNITEAFMSLATELKVREREEKYYLR